MNHRILFLLFFSSVSLFSLAQSSSGGSTILPKGKLFIIGGGKRTPALMDALVKSSGIDKGGYIFILPMASEEVDTAILYSTRQFTEMGFNKVVAYNFKIGEKISQTKLDSLKNARLIYISGGNQNLFMKVVFNTPVYHAIHEAYQNGATIAGTSAGAAVMSKKMITGDEAKHVKYSGEYKTIEANNIVIGEGLGLIDNAIVDQHFVKRMRMNRLIATVIENPEMTCIGIDESTAILVEQSKATVFGESQVIVLNNKKKSIKISEELLGAKDLELSVYLPFDTFSISNR